MTKKYLIKLTEKQVNEPVLAECILKTGVPINMLRADANGNILIRFPKEKEKTILSFLKERGVPTSEQKDAVLYDKEKCINCGACVAICPVGAFSINKEGKLEYDEDKCALCGNCIDACPRGALKKPEF